MEELCRLLGGEIHLAELLGVRRRQVSRWQRCEQQPSMRNAAAMKQLLGVTRAATAVWGDPAVVFDWLTGPNAHLGGAAPIAVLRHRGPGDVLACLGEEAGGGLRIGAMWRNRTYVRYACPCGQRGALSCAPERGPRTPRFEAGVLWAEPARPRAAGVAARPDHRGGPARLDRWRHRVRRVGASWGVPAILDSPA